MRKGAVLLCCQLVFLSTADGGIISEASWRNFQAKPRSVSYLFDESFVDIRLQQKVSEVTEQLIAFTGAEFNWLSDNDLEANRTAYLLFIQHPDPHKCVAQNGMRIGATPVSLGSNCGSETLTCLRTILYALGVEYEHLRRDRNKYVHVNLSNVKAEASHLFTKTLHDDEYRTVTSYDISSVMHFGPQEHAESHQHPVIWSRNDILQPSVGSNVRQKHDLLSFRDKKTVCELLHCSSGCERRECEHAGYTNKQCQCVCPYGFTGETCQVLSHSGRYNEPHCGQLAERSGDIVSPNYPKHYPRGAFCQWLVRGSKRTEIVVFKINNFDLEHENVLPSDRCLDKLFIWIDGTDVVTKHLSCLPDESAKYVNKWFSSQYEWLLVELRTDPWGQFNHEGFNLSYRIVDTAPPPESKEKLDSEEDSAISNYTKQLRKHIGERRLYCHHCHNSSHCETIVDYDERSSVLCLSREACAFKLDGQNNHVWRGCSPIDQCGSARKEWYRSDSEDYMDCCPDDFCNIFSNKSTNNKAFNVFIYCVLIYFVLFLW